MGILILQAQVAQSKGSLLPHAIGKELVIRILEHKANLPRQFGDGRLPGIVAHHLDLTIARLAQS